MEAVNKLNIIDYDCYRTYLADYFQAKKEANPNFSLTMMANKVGQSKMTIKYLLDKKRHISEKNIAIFANALKLDPSQTRYFHALVKFNKSKTGDEKNIHFRELLKIKGSPFKDLYLQDSDAGYLSSWFYPAIAELSYVRGFNMDPANIKQSLYFSVSIDEIRSALHFLNKYGFLKDSQGDASKIKIPENFRGHIYKEFAAKQIELAKESIFTQDPSEREISNLTISVPEEKYQMAKQMIADFRHQLHEMLANDEECERVIQINMQLFTLAKHKELSQ